MKANTAGAVVIGLAILALFVLGGGAMMGGGIMGRNMAGSAWMGGGGWLWVPAALLVCLGAMAALGLFGRK